VGVILWAEIRAGIPAPCRKGERIVYFLQKSDYRGHRSHDRGSLRLSRNRRRSLYVYRAVYRLYRHPYRHVDSSRRLRVGIAAFSRRSIQFQLQFKPNSGSVNSQWSEWVTLRHPSSRTRTGEHIDFRNERQLQYEFGRNMVGLRSTRRCRHEWHLEHGFQDSDSWAFSTAVRRSLSGGGSLLPWTKDEDLLGRPRAVIPCTSCVVGQSQLSAVAADGKADRVPLSFWRDSLAALASDRHPSDHCIKMLSALLPLRCPIRLHALGLCFARSGGQPLSFLGGERMRRCGSSGILRRAATPFDGTLESFNRAVEFVALRYE